MMGGLIVQQRPTRGVGQPYAVVVFNARFMYRLASIGATRRG